MIKRFKTGIRHELLIPFLFVFFFAFAYVLFAGVTPAMAYDGRKFRMVCRLMLGLAGGDFASLLAAVSGLGAVIASATGGFKMAWGLLVVSVGSYILMEYTKLWFDDCRPAL